MLSTLILYLTQKFETFNYLQKVYGLGVAREINESKLISVYDGNTEQHLNLDTHESLSVFLTNGNKTVEQIESEVVANEYHVKHTYPFKCLIYAKSNENVNCSSQSRLIADSIEKSITGRQKALLTSTQLVNAYIEVKNTTLEKHTLYANYFTGGGLGDNDILIEIEFDFIVEGNQNCFVDSPCDNDDFVFDFEQPQSFCERVDECLGIPTTNGQYVLTITDEVITWEEFSASGLVDGNGTTINGNKVDLGGDVIQDTILSFNPTENYITFGNIDNGTAFYYGNLLGDGSRLGSVGNKAIAFTTDLDNGRTANIVLDDNDGTGHSIAGMNIIDEDNDDYGIYIFDNGGKKTSNLYYGIRPSGSTIDISRIEANKDEVHGRHIIDGTGVIQNYNGFHANDTYTQLEYNKVAGDGQDTGTLLTLNADGVNHFQGGAILNQFDNSGFMYIGSESVDGSWRFATDSGNLVIQKRVSGSWVTKQTLV